MYQEIVDFLKQEGIRSTQSLNTLLTALEEQEEDDLAQDVEQAMKDFNLLGGQRIETLILSLVDEEIDQAGDEEEEEVDEGDETEELEE
jgi:hypothetical protein